MGLLASACPVDFSWRLFLVNALSDMACYVFHRSEDLFIMLSDRITAVWGSCAQFSSPRGDVDWLLACMAVDGQRKLP